MKHSQTSIKLKAATLKKIESDYPFVISVAKRNIPKLRDSISGNVMHQYLSTWEDALMDKDTLLSVVADQSVYGFDLWQINPFTGIFTPKERWDVLRAVDAAHELRRNETEVSHA